MQRLFGVQVQQLPIVLEKKRQITCPDILPNPFKARDVSPPLSNVPMLGPFNMVLAANFTAYMLNGVRSVESLTDSGLISNFDNSVDNGDRRPRLQVLGR